VIEKMSWYDILSMNPIELRKSMKKFMVEEDGEM